MLIIFLIVHSTTIYTRILTIDITVEKKILSEKFKKERWYKKHTIIMAESKDNLDNIFFSRKWGT